MTAELVTHLTRTLVVLDVGGRVKTYTDWGDRPDMVWFVFACGKRSRKLGKNVKKQKW